MPKNEVPKLINAIFDDSEMKNKQDTGRAKEFDTKNKKRSKTTEGETT
ncbi:hypothetical protein WD019_05485 [Fictibacillus sp. Mic-4]|nr:hypothetical protein [Fictibacillus gelatini]